ncbi:MAG: hypothetical protein HYS98_09030 [Deltaproteobacteria bacterium]|nr:hypothetical protein [Deltaproteobacteria bacterium]
MFILEVSRKTTHPVLFVCSARIANTDNIYPNENDVRVEKLEALKEASISEILRVELGGTTAPELEKFVSNKAQGNPFFAFSIAAEMKHQNLVYQDENLGVWKLRDGVEENGTTSLSDNLRELAERRLEALPEPARQVYQILSVLTPGLTLDYDLLEWLSLETRAFTHQTRMPFNLFQLGILEREGLIVWEGENILHLRHAVYKEAAVAAMNPSQREAVHYFAAGMLPAVYSQEQIVDDMIYHLRRAGDKAQSELSVWLERGFERAFAANDMVKARALGEEKIILDISKLEKSKSSLSSLRIKLVDVYDHLGDTDQALTVALELTGVTNGANLVMSHIKTSQLYMKKGETEKGTSFANSAAEIANASGDSILIAESKKQLGNVALESGNNSEAERLYTESLALASRIPTAQHLVAQIEFNLGLISNANNNPTKAMGHFKESDKADSDIDNILGASRARAQLAFVHHNIGESQQAIEIWNSILPVYEVFHYIDGIFNVHRLIGKAYLKIGVFNRAEIHLKIALDLVNKNEVAISHLFLLIDLAELELEKPDGSLETVRKRLSDALTRAMTLGRRTTSAHVHALMAKERLKAGVPQMANSHLAKAVKLLKSSTGNIHQGTYYECLLLIIETHIALESFEDAAYFAKALEASLSTKPQPEVTAKLDALKSTLSEHVTESSERAGTIGIAEVHARLITPRSREAGRESTARVQARVRSTTIHPSP